MFNASVLVWINQYLLRRISTEEYAIYPVVAALMVFSPLFSLMLTGGVSRYVVEAYARGKTERVTCIVSSIYPFIFASALVLLTLGWTFALNIGHIMTINPHFVDDARWMMGLLVLGTVSELLLMPLGFGIQVHQRFVLLNGIKIGREFLRITILFTLLFGVSTRVLWVVVAGVSANFITLLITNTISRRLMPSLRFRLRLFDWATARELMSFGSWTVLGQVASIIYNSADAIILNKLGTAVDVTSFYVGSMCDRQVRSMVMMASAPVQPPLTAMFSLRDIPRLGNAFLRGGRYALWATLLAACPLVVFREPVIRLYVGGVYLQAATVILLLSLLYPFTYSAVMLNKVATAMARVRLFYGAGIVTQLLNLGLTIYLVGWLKWGAVGSATGTLIVTLLSQVLLFWPMGLHMTQISFRRFLREALLPGLLPSLAALAVWLPLAHWVHPQSWLSLGCCAAAGMAVYCPVLLLFCLQSHERNDLRNMLVKYRQKPPSQIEEPAPIPVRKIKL